MRKFDLLFSIRYHNVEVECLIKTLGCLANCDAYLSNYWSLLVFRSGNQGRLVTPDLHQRCKSNVPSLEKLLSMWPGNS